MDQRLQQRTTALALAGAGVAAGTAQVVLVRELLKIAAGNELTLGIMLAAWLLWGAVGASIGGRLGLRRSAKRAGPAPDGDNPTGALTVAAAAVGCGFYVLELLCLYAVRGTPALMTRLPGAWTVQPGQVLGLAHLAVVSTAAVLPVALLAGMQFALALRLYAARRRDARAVSMAYAYDALGHLGGGAAAAVLLAAGAAAQPIALVGGLAILWGGAAPAMASAAAPEGRPRAGVSAFAALALLSIVFTYAASRPIPSALARRTELLAERESPHGSLAVGRNGPFAVTFYLNGVPEATAPPTPHIQYLVHFPLLQVRQPRRVLLLGGGATGGLAEALQYPGLRIDYVELDPALIRLARRYTAPAERAALADPRVRVLTTDGRLWVKQLPDEPAYDAVLLCLPDPSTAQVNRFYTRDFLAELARVLRPGGVVGLQMPSSETYLGEELLRLNAVLLRTVESVFPGTALLPGDPLVVAATRDGDLTEDPQVLRGRYDRLRLQAPDFRAHTPDRLFPFSLSQFRDSMAQAPPLPLNTDLHPVGYFYDQAFWVAQHSRGSWRVFAGLSRLSVRRLTPPLLAVLLLALVVGVPSRRVRRGYVPLAVLGTGAVAMALELVVLFAFQVQYGYVYQLLGVLTGAFMVGLAGGGMAAGRAVAERDGRGARRLLCLLQCALAAAAFLLPQVLSGVGTVASAGTLAWLAPYVLFPLLAVALGGLAGAQFPAAARAAAGEGSATAARAGAALYAADLAGAALGALLAGAALIPVLGLPGTCYLAAIVSAGLTGLLAMDERRG